MKKKKKPIVAITTLIIAAIEDYWEAFCKDDFRKEPKGIVLSPHQWRRIRSVTSRNMMDMIVFNDGHPTLFGLRVILSYDAAGPMVVGRDYIAAMSYYPKLLLKLL